MLRLDYFLFGYRVFRFNADMTSIVATRILENGISAKISRDGSILVFEPFRKRYLKAFSGLEYNESELLGLPGAFIRNKWRVGAMVAILIVVGIFAFTSGYVWNIEISGNETVSTVEILDNLSSAGLDVGSRWRSVDRAKTERAILESYDKIAWININRRGNVAYVTVKERGVENQISMQGSPSNIVAAADCVIEEITVISGIAMVKPGDTVKKGDLLISGVIPAELGGGFVVADGEVYGRLEERTEIFVARQEQEKRYQDEKLQNLEILIFDFNINIFKRYGNSLDDCVIIEEDKRLILFDEVVLPITIRAKYKKSYDIVDEIHSDDKLIKLAQSRLNQKRMLALSDSELLSIKNGGEFTDDGYCIWSDMIIIRNVCERMPLLEN